MDSKREVMDPSEETSVSAPLFVRLIEPLLSSSQDRLSEKGREILEANISENIVTSFVTFRLEAGELPSSACSTSELLLCVISFMTIGFLHKALFFLMYNN
jgi:hypothetical protein